jgi:hypothetical protein
MDLVKFKNEVSQEEERLGINQNARVPIDVLEKTRGK